MKTPATIISTFALAALGLVAYVWLNHSKDGFPDVELLGVATIPGDASDLSGLNDILKDGTPHNRLGGLGSGIAWTLIGDKYVLVSDRGPKDGAVDFKCRFHTFEIQATPAVRAKQLSTHLLFDDKGRPFVGGYDATDPAKPGRFDPEGIRVGLGGTIWISDEYGPAIVEFDANGSELRRLAIPAKFLIEGNGGAPDKELPPRNAKGRQPNRGMEGLAISPNGLKLYGIMQSPLIQDGALGTLQARVGRNCRILEIDVAKERTREFVYPLENPALGVSEIVAVDDHSFLVLERDGKGGIEAGFKKIFRIDIDGATDVSNVDALPANELPDGVRPVNKNLFLDLLEPKLGIAGGNCPEKFEGLAFGPDLPDGRRLLLVTADNDFIATAPLRIYAFAVRR